MLLKGDKIDNQKFSDIITDMKTTERMWNFLKEIKISVPCVDNFWIQNEPGTGECEWLIGNKFFGFNQFTGIFRDGLTEKNFIEKMKEAISNVMNFDI